MNLLKRKKNLIREGFPSVLVFDVKKPPWPEPELSLGLQCVSSGGLQCWHVTGPALELFERIASSLAELLEKHQEAMENLEAKPAMISFSMWMIGQTARSANPTIVFASRSLPQRVFAKDILKQSKLLDGYPGVRVKTLDKVPAVKCAALSDPDSDNQEVSDRNIYLLDDSRGTCGALIAVGASRLATMGGILFLDRTRYGITAQHIRFDCEEEAQNEIEEQQPLCFDEDSDVEEPELFEVTSGGSLSSDSSHFCLTQSSGSATSAQCDELEQFDSIVTDAQNPVSEHETEHSIERWHEKPTRISELSSKYVQSILDYEIFELEDSFCGANQLYLFDGNGRENVVRPSDIAPKPLEAAVWAATGPTGCCRGSMTLAPHFIKMNGFPGFQELWAVNLTRRTRPGDCGAWVVDITGEIYGHIIAGDPASTLAFIVPAYKVFNDIERRFGSAASLPSNTESKVRAFDDRFDSARRWLALCERSHNKCGHEGQDTKLPTRILDLGQDQSANTLMLVRPKHTFYAPYVALSYFGGSHESWMLTLDNFQSFVHGEIKTSELPLLFQQAISTTRSIGIRYLWIDALCILHDLEEDWMYEASCMRDTYRNATVTIRALASPYDYHGLFFDLQPLEAAVKIDIQRSRSRQRSRTDYVKPRNKRAWAVNESPRILWFSSKQVLWKCREFDWEDHESPPYHYGVGFYKESNSYVRRTYNPALYNRASEAVSLVKEYTGGESLTLPHEDVR